MGFIPDICTDKMYLVRHVWVISNKAETTMTHPIQIVNIRYSPVGFQMLYATLDITIPVQSRSIIGIALFFQYNSFKHTTSHMDCSQCAPCKQDGPPLLNNHKRCFSLEYECLETLNCVKCTKQSNMQSNLKDGHPYSQM